MSSTLQRTSALTRSFDNSRSGANLGEVVLTQTVVRHHGLRRAFSVQLPGDARGTEGAPLVVPHLPMSDGQVHDVLFAASMANTVHAWDANDGTLLWARRIGKPILGSRTIDAYEINDHWGVLSTPVIDPETSILYCVAWSGDTAQTASFYLHGLQLEDGAPAFAPVDLETAIYDSGHGLPRQSFRSAARKQRCALLFTEVNGIKTVFIASGSISESLASNRGWVIAVDVTAIRRPIITAAWAASARESGGGIWMGGQGPAAIDNKLYLMTGNGAFDGITDFGECLLELTYTPPHSHPASLVCTDWFSPFSDAGRDGQDPTHTHIDEGPNNNPSNTNGWEDMDLGSGGLVVVPELGYAIGAGKDGIAYVLELGNFGKTQPSDFAGSKIAGNYAKARWIGWFTYYNPDVSPIPNKLTDLNMLYAGRTRHQHSTPVVYKSGVHGWMCFCWGENSQLRAWKIEPDGSLTYLAASQEFASAQCGFPGGMPGGMLSLSANGSQVGSAVLWACIPYQDANKVIADGRLLAYDPENFIRIPNGDHQIVKLWDSQDWGLQFKFNKFNIPVAVNGQLYVPTYNGTIDVYR